MMTRTPPVSNLQAGSRQQQRSSWQAPPQHYRFCHSSVHIIPVRDITTIRVENRSCLLSGIQGRKVWGHVVLALEHDWCVTCLLAHGALMPSSTCPPHQHKVFVAQPSLSTLSWFGTSECQWLLTRFGQEFVSFLSFFLQFRGSAPRYTATARQGTCSHRCNPSSGSS